MHLLTILLLKLMVECYERFAKEFRQRRKCLNFALSSLVN